MFGMNQKITGPIILNVQSIQDMERPRKVTGLIILKVQANQDIERPRKITKGRKTREGRKRVRSENCQVFHTCKIANDVVIRELTLQTVWLIFVESLQ
jgi:hypothetical protein